MPGPRLAPVISADDGEEHVDPAGVCRARLRSGIDQRPGAALRFAIVALTSAERLQGEARRVFLRQGIGLALVALATEA
jgi:hypothetical protein